MNLIRFIVGNNMVQYGEMIDWLLSEEKFYGWERNDVGNFTKKLHRLELFSPQRDLHYHAAIHLSFPQKAKRFPQVWIAKGDSEGRDWIRHLRNGIAHGNATVITKGENTILKIKDYMSDGKTQTAFFLIPLSYLILIYNTYREIERGKTKVSKK